MPIRKGDGTGVAPKGIAEVRTGDGRVLFNAIPDSVTHQYVFDEGSGSTINDNQGSVNGTLNGPDWITDANAVGGYVLDFPSADYIDMGADVYALGNNDWTITAFVNPDNFNNDRDFFSNKDGTSGISLSFKNRKLTCTFEFVANYKSNLRPSTNTWQFASVRHDASAGELNFDLDGSSDTVSVGSVNASSGTVTIGGNTDDGVYFIGQMDEVTVSDSYLSDADVQTLRDRR